LVVADYDGEEITFIVNPHYAFPEVEGEARNNKPNRIEAAQDKQKNNRFHFLLNLNPKAKINQYGRF